MSQAVEFDQASAPPMPEAEPRATGALSVAAIGLSNALLVGVAFAREVLLAKHFGLTVLGDAFAIANTLPELYLNFLTGGLLANALIPILARQTRSGQEAEGLGAIALAMRWTLLATAALLALSLIAVRWAIRPFAPAAGPETINEAARTALLLWPVMPLLLAGGFAAAVMQHRRRFLAPALAPVVYNLPLVIALVLFGARWGTLAAAGGALLGAAAQLVLQWPGIRQIEASARAATQAQRRMAAGLLYTVLPVALTQIAAHAGRCLGRAIATTQGVGGVAALTYAFRMIQVPVWLAVIPVSVVFLPALSSYVAASAGAKARDLAERALSVTLFVTVPVAVLTYVLRFDLARLVFERGAFDHQATLLTGRTMGAYALCIVPQGIGVLLARLAYARSDTAAPLKAVAAELLVVGLVSWALSRSLGLPGIALGAFAGVCVEVVLLMVREHGHGVITGRNAAVTILLPCAAGLPMAAAAWSVRGLVQARWTGPSPGLEALVTVLAVSASAGAVYVIASALLRLRGYEEARQLAPRLLRALSGHPAE